MVFRANSKDIHKLLSSVFPAVPGRTTLQILEKFLVETDSGLLTVTASDEQIRLKASIPVESDQNIAAVIDAKFLLDLVSSFQDTTVTCQKESDTQLILKTDTGNYEVSYSSADEYPPLKVDDQDTIIELDGQILKSAIDTGAFAITKGAMRVAMQGMSVELTDAGLRFVMTDGHRLVKIVKNNIIFENEDQFTIPERAVTVLPKILHDGAISIRMNKRSAHFKLGAVELFTRLIDEKFPDYNSVIPVQNENHLFLNREALLRSIERMLIFRSGAQPLVKLTIEADSVEVSSEDIDRGSNAKDVLPCNYQGTPMTIGFNTTYLRDVLTHIRAAEVVIKMSTPSRAAVIEPAVQPEDENLLMLLMPLRLNV